MNLQNNKVTNHSQLRQNSIASKTNEENYILIKTLSSIFLKKMYDKIQESRDIECEKSFLE